jgi:protein TonB
MAMNWSVYQKRETAAQLGTATIAVLGLLLTQTITIHRETPAQDTPISLTLAATEAPPNQVVQPPKLPQPQKVVEPQKQEVLPVTDMPSPVPQVVEKAAPATPVEPAVAQPRQAEADATYISKILGYLYSIKRYPTSREARLQRPVGKVEVWFVLTRNGHLLEAGIENSSHSLILDAAALSTVRGGGYPSFPEEVWAGETSHRFTVVLDYFI